jgi:hypothetical protein
MKDLLVPIICHTSSLLPVASVNFARAVFVVELMGGDEAMGKSSA